MQIHPVVVQVAGVITVTMQASFVGDPTDATDQQRIQGYGDPLVNLGGLFTDPADATFQFVFPATELYVGVTTQMQSYPAQFASALPVPPAATNISPSATFQNSSGSCSTPNSALPAATSQAALTTVTTNPVRAATIWAATIETRIAAAMAVLRAKSPAQLTSLPNATV